MSSEFATIAKELMEAGTADAPVSDETLSSGTEEAAVEVQTDNAEAVEATPQEGESAPEETTGRKRSWRDIKWDDEVDWDGFEKEMDHLPAPFAKKRSNMDRLLQQKNEELLAERARVTALLEERVKKPEPEQAPKNEEPPLPLDTDDDATYKAKLAEWARYQARQEVAGTTAAYQQKLAQIEQIIQSQQQAALVASVEGRLNSMRARADYTEQVEQKMTDLAQKFPHWQAALATEDGFEDLYRFAVSQTAAVASQAQAAKHQATAKERVVTRPGSVKEASAAIKGNTVREIFSELRESGEFG